VAARYLLFAAANFHPVHRVRIHQYKENGDYAMLSDSSANNISKRRKKGALWLFEVIRMKQPISTP